jgi:5'(3')-deoxyribonucleotidase
VRNMKAVIAIDIDGVLADIHSIVIQKIFQKKLGLKTTPTPTKWDFFDEIGITRKEFWRTYIELWSKEYDVIPLIEPDAPTIIAELRKTFSVAIVSSRPKETWFGTVLWLRLRGIQYDGLRLLPPKTDKASEEYNIIVDDNPELAQRCKNVIIYDRPWNRGIDGVRIRSLKELLTLSTADLRGEK